MSRRLHPRSRQRSCVACANGKRRCSRTSPQCARCFAQGLECIYVRGQPSRQLPEPSDDSGIPSFLPLDDSSLYDDTAWPPSPSLLTVPTFLPAGFFQETTTLDRWSTTHLLRNVKSYPRTFARSQKTPFIHPRLYDAYLPDAIQDAFTVSAAYHTKTPETEDTVFRILIAKTTNLAAQPPGVKTTGELLAALQALILLTIIQLFDGDVRQRSTAEQNMATLRSWTLQLQARTGELDPAPTWTEWILAESVRRTVILSVMLDGLYSALRFGYCTNVRAMSMLPFTSGAAWGVESSAAWVVEARRARS
ncbi:Zn(II)2Cys6 transcription factor, partial [Candidatus Bathyarchaeota archaeon]|nr:Zn(II)2Cys6 transcription factor [Candidatus Bathyarchaeota archaeon]